MTVQYDRRDFLRLGAAAGTTLALGGASLPGCTKQLKGTPPQIKAAAIDTVRIGFVGVGGMGSVHIKNLLAIEGVQIRAVCDIIEEKVVRIQQWVQEAGQPRPAGYWRSETDFKRMCDRDDLDLVFTATPWRWHVPVCVAAMEAGKHTATEVPAAVTIDECWQLVETSEKTNRYCVMMENCCYSQWMLMVLNMVRKGVFGELLHGQAGYLHDLRALKFSSKGEGLWRRQHSDKRDGNLYPTHGLGPVAQCMDINRGDRFDYLVSMSSKSAGLNLYAAGEFGHDHPLAKQKYALGDINITLIRTVNGKTITLYHDCSAPRPYSRIDLVQGTKGIFRRYPAPPKIYIEGKSPPHEWESIDTYAVEYEHPLWKALKQKGAHTGHGSMDYIEDYRLIKALRGGTVPDMDVYDAASWSVVSELSERSVANKSRPIDFPDFTRGNWKTNPPLGIVEA